MFPAGVASALAPCLRHSKEPTAGDAAQSNTSFTPCPHAVQPEDRSAPCTRPCTHTWPRAAPSGRWVPAHTRPAASMWAPGRLCPSAQPLWKGVPTAQSQSTYYVQGCWALSGQSRPPRGSWESPHVSLAAASTTGSLEGPGDHLGAISQLSLYRSLYPEVLDLFPWEGNTGG